MPPRANESARRAERLVAELRKLGWKAAASATRNAVYAVAPTGRPAKAGVRVWLPDPAVSTGYTWRTAGRRHHHAPGDTPAGEVAARVAASLAARDARDRDGAST